MTVDELLAGVPAPVARSTRALRRIVRETHEEFTEHVYPGWKALGYRDREAGYVCGIFPRADAVQLVFEHGARLPDPDGLLTGSGRQTRNVVLRPGDPIPEEGIRGLILRALHRAAT